jgi:hypothetical protein
VNYLTLDLLPIRFHRPKRGRSDALADAIECDRPEIRIHIHGERRAVMGVCTSFGL